MHAEVTQVSVRSTHSAKQARHTCHRVTTAHMARSHDQLNQQKTAGYLRINLKPRPEWMYGKKA